MKSHLRLFYLCSAVCIIHPAFADYTGEAGIGYSKLKDTPSNDKISYQKLGATFYFDMIQTSDGPLAEAAFLNPTSNFNFNFDQWKYEYPASSAKQKQTLIGLGFVNSSHNIEFNIKFGDTKHTFSPNALSAKSDDLSFGINFYPAKGQSIGISHDTSSFDDNVTNDKITDDHIFYRQLLTLAAQQYLSIEIGHENTKYAYKDGYGPDYATKINDIQATYYISRETGFLFRYAKYNSDDSSGADGNLMSIGIESFVTPNVELGFGYLKYSADSALDEDTKGFVATLASRF